ncbi:Predicted dehydrogenase [Zhouia amylolytica]|uniref:Predicted dehydrogenase n=1 Tax=Zhouia amylolytica TaxID=376730 RepID=A0A1I6S666_9FLAO|nr:Gfo/Idh/MocA family oxidoreductase [Zhouia amylolytica]MCQ0111001.1 Gfo/Idh/MocA family oxidoreductase [Zhouia amylolytica]SFS72426.1 Predicted dehydrogenase [Zhouia amylolytica]
MSQTIKTGLLSYGTSGKIFHAPFIDTHLNFELTAVVERSVKKAHLDYPRVKSYDKVEDMIRDEKIELIIVNTPNSTHFDFALQALKHGKHVLVEKAFTCTSIEAQQLFNEAQKRKLYVLPYQNRRYDGDFLSVKNILESGVLGQVVEVHLHFDRYRNTISPKAKEKPGLGGGIQYDLGPHIIDAALALFGTPHRYTKTLGYFRPNTMVDDYAHFHLSYADGKQVFVSTSMLVADPQPGFIIHGTKGSFVKPRVNVQEEQLLEGIKLTAPEYGYEEDFTAGQLTLINEDGAKTKQMIKAERGNYLKVFDDVYHTIKFDKPYPVSKDEIIKQLEILES